MSLVSFEDYHGFLAGDEGGSETGLIVIQEWWGINQNIKNITLELSGQGFLAIAPDLYHGKVAATADEAKHLMDNLDWGGALKMIGAAVRFLKSKGAKKVGIVGFCMGGAVSIAAAAKVPGIDAAAPFYGIPPAQFVDPSTIKVPLQLHFGRLDDSKGFSSPEDVAKLETVLKGNVEYEVCWYDADHAFMNSARPEVYHSESASLAFERILVFFREKLYTST